MIDSVLKGTGNSRFLKSAVPAGTSWADALAMLQAGTFPIDFNGINAEGFQQVGTPLNKANLLKDATAAQIGLPPSTTPDGMFQALGNTGDLYVWRKTKKVGSKGYYLDTVSSGRLSFVKNGAYVVTFSYSDTVSPNGALSGTVNTVSLSGTGDQTSKLSVLRGKFCRAESSGGSDSAFSGIIYIPNDATFTYKMEGLDYHSHYVDKKQTVVFTDAPTTTTYHVSINPNAYQEGSNAKPAGYTLGDVVSGHFGMGMRYSGISYEYYLADELSVDENGVVSLKNPQEDNIGQSSGHPGSAADWQSTISGKYIQLYSGPKNNSSNSAMSGPFHTIPSNIVYIPNGAAVTLERVGSDNDYYYIDRYQPVTGYPAIPAGTTIEYLGKLGDKARAQVVSYVGTGTYGYENPTKLTFDFKPNVVFIARKDDRNFSAIIVLDTNNVTTNAKRDFYANLIWEEKTIKLYSHSSGVQQMNESGGKFVAVAIG